MLPKMNLLNPVYSSWLSFIHIPILRMQPYFNPLNPTHQNEIKSEDQDVWQGIKKGMRRLFQNQVKFGLRDCRRYFSLQLLLVNYSKWWLALSKSIRRLGVPLISILVMHWPDMRLCTCLDFCLVSLLIFGACQNLWDLEKKIKSSIVMFCCRRFYQY